MHLPGFLTRPAIIGLASSPRDSNRKVILDSFFILNFIPLLLKSQVCAPGIQFMDGIVPHEEDVHVRDTSPLPTCELQNGCSQFCLLDTSSLWWWCHPPRLQEEGARVEGSRGLCGRPQCSSSPWWRSLAWSRGTGDSAASPFLSLLLHSISHCSWGIFQYSIKITVWVWTVNWVQPSVGRWVRGILWNENKITKNIQSYHLHVLYSF